jgi:organic radical activating enzyme
MFVSFQGEGTEVGRRHLFIRFSGCNLRCRYCDTPSSLEREAEYRIHSADGLIRGTNPIDKNTILNCFAELRAQAGALDGVALTGGEPLLQAEFIAHLLEDDSIPRPRLLETAGVLPDKLAVVLPFVEIVSMDIKLPSNSGEPHFWAEHESFLEQCRDRVYVKILVDDGTSASDLDRAAQMIRRTAPEVPVFLQPITGADGRVEAGWERLEESFSILRNYVSDVRVLPQTHKMLGVR